MAEHNNPGCWVSSEVLRFLVGSDEQKKFVVHESVLANLSAGMKAFVETAKLEENTEIIQWAEIEPETADCLVEFAYTGDFKSPGFQRMATGQVVENYRKLHTRPQFGSSKVLEWAWEEFVSKSWDYNEKQMLYDISQDTSKPDALCTVAQVYGFACDYGIEDLKALALNKLHRLMVCFQDEDDIIKFLWLCADYESSDELFRTASQYATLTVGLFESKEPFKALMSEHPIFAESAFWWQQSILHQYA
ncbi:BTB/POZ fold protein [Akanthomyces lecanii RCEF 1005]|uniref:BTB/POZ fold protein n=1 Tax=Akanthomyces lecanii RCEF 1005 TaxID=1081108 RepID=A0A162KN31_CORDF|nr:BTB/POZ fold protein [Akanthomyces lecanii RCEF 1005]